MKSYIVGNFYIVQTNYLHIYKSSQTVQYIHINSCNVIAVQSPEKNVNPNCNTISLVLSS